MAKTAPSMSVNNTTGAAIIPSEYCSRIVLYEANQAATTNFLVDLGNFGNFVQRAAGERYEIVAPGPPGNQFKPNVSIGTIKTAAGTATFNQEEY